MNEQHPDWLDHALQRHARPPAVPTGLGARVQAALAQARQQQALAELQQRQALLEAELAQARAHLRQRRWQGSTQVLGVAVTVSFASGALATWSLPWWQPWLDPSASTLLPLIALALGVASAAAAARVHWGRGWF